MKWLKRFRVWLFGRPLVYLQSSAVKDYSTWIDPIRDVEYLIGPKDPWPKSVTTITRDWSKTVYAIASCQLEIMNNVETYDLDDLDLDRRVYRHIVESLVTQGQFGMSIFSVVETHRRKRKSENAPGYPQLEPLDLSQRPIATRRS